MKKTNWSKIIKEIKRANRGISEPCYTGEVISKITGICTSTLSRLVSQPQRMLNYDEGIKLMALYNELKDKGKIQK